MDTLHKRFALFLFGCIPTRLLLVYLATFPSLLQYIGYITLVIGLGFLVIYFTGSRPTGAEVFGGKIWWNTLRPIHALLYLTFSYLALIEHSDKAWIVLAADTCLGLVSFFTFHTLN